MLILLPMQFRQRKVLCRWVKFLLKIIVLPIANFFSTALIILSATTASSRRATKISPCGYSTKRKLQTSARHGNSSTYLYLSLQYYCLARSTSGDENNDIVCRVFK